MIIRNCKRELKKDYDCIKVKLELNKTGCLLAVALNQFSNVLWPSTRGFNVSQPPLSQSPIVFFSYIEFLCWKDLERKGYRTLWLKVPVLRSSRLFIVSLRHLLKMISLSGRNFGLWELTRREAASKKLNDP